MSNVEYPILTCVGGPLAGRQHCFGRVVHETELMAFERYPIKDYLSIWTATDELVIERFFCIVEFIYAKGHEPIPYLRFEGINSHEAFLDLLKDYKPGVAP